MINFRPTYEPLIKFCKELIAEKKVLIEENEELKEMLESAKHDLFYTREQNRFLSETLLYFQEEKRKDLEKRVADLEEQLAKKVFLLDDNSTPIKSFTLTGKLTVMDEPTEEKLEVGKWYDAEKYTVEELEEILPRGTKVTVLENNDNDRVVDINNEGKLNTTVKYVEKRWGSGETRITTTADCFIRRYFKITE